MLHLYYSNHLDTQQALLIRLLALQPLVDPFQSEQILVQSQGMAQWLKLQIAEKCGVAANISFPLPASFIWHQYHRTLSDVPQHNAFEKERMQWHLMALIPTLLDQPDFGGLKKYLREQQHGEQEKLYQLSGKIADLFDQYLVYRPDWISAWEAKQDQNVLQQLLQGVSTTDNELSARFRQDLQSAVSWQGQLWRALYARIERQAAQKQERCWHRAALHRQYLQTLAEQQPKHLPQRLFIFGISALPNVYLQTLQAMAQYCEVHLFFNNPCRYYWGDIIDPAFLQKLKLRKRLKPSEQASSDWLNEKQLAQLAQPDWQDDPLGYLQTGNPLLAAWGKMGRDFLALLSQSEANEIDAYAAADGDSLLAQLQNAILDLQELQKSPPFLLAADDQSLSIHACHSPMREVEVLHDQLLHWFQQDNSLTPKDVVVMVADVDRYVPYIHAAFSQYSYSDPRFIPYEIADRKHTHSDVLIATFLQLLQLQESDFSAETVLALLDVPELRERFELDLKELEILQRWVAENGIRYGLSADQNAATLDQVTPNYNAWQSGLQRMLLGAAMRENDGIWQETVAFELSYGLNAQIVGKLGEFLDCLQHWHTVLQQEHSIEQWQQQLHWLLQTFFGENEHSRAVLLFLTKRIDEICQTALDSAYDQALNSAVIAELFSHKLSEEDNSFHFLNGKLSFCTLLPMRAIPFKVVALLGMNEGDYPRQHNPNSFDLMQYHQQKGDRVRRDDDRYLFLEAILSAQQKLYISYVGRSLIDNQPLQPSVLVSQLLDYLADQTELAQADDEEQNSENRLEKVRSALVQQHPMTVFSRDNFLLGRRNRSFAKEWLAGATDNAQVSGFLQPLAGEPQAENVIALEQLIRFVQSPLAYFFQNQLGVYFTQDENEWADSENFALDSLQRYTLSERLLQQAPNEWQAQLRRFELKGELPRANFAAISQQKLSERLRPLSAVIEPYLSQSATALNIDIGIEIDGGRYRLQGEVGGLYPQPDLSQTEHSPTRNAQTKNTQIKQVAWRAGSIKVKQLIQYWIEYLALLSQLNLPTEKQTADSAPHFYGLDGDKIQSYGFSPLSAEQAQRQLGVYMQDFMQSEQRLLPLPTTLYDDFLSGKKSEQDLLNAILKLGENGFQPSDKADPYWQRLLAQTPPDDLAANLAEMAEKMQAWFALMKQNLLTATQSVR
ncbi:DNA helicase/exodeoxyribonuclease V, gamma subunit [Pasteurella testudinis DSM 23072]|uniref:RecBCD enzyme subunit RecC n=1 Tax=Pasteurella testudinis DSM 23072 TaxID=1122938 RepID=A0A1W1VA67_9PAST|nr:exodeoxyribonuclease V subunit gamma [Pasteurella testudinis]SMB90176.1 DNA helicase/exodeoxyribonuclease V, gamma subunit [Pasteurella testudinis DSM 23072]SUB51347.1 exodeoxyribonuclease V gamma subunit [Pasteurella testudinis]